MATTSTEEFEQQLAAIADSREKIGWLLEAGRPIRYSNPELACEYAERGLQIAEETNDRYWIARMLYALVMFEKMKCYVEPQRNLQRLHRAASLFQELSEEVWLAKVLAAQTEAYQAQQDYEQATQVLEESNAIFKRYDDKKNYAEGLCRFAEIYHDRGVLPQEVEVLAQALTLYSELDDAYGKGYCYNVLGGVYMTMAEPAKALEYYVKGLECMQEFGQPMLKAIGLINIGNASMDLKRYDEALENYQYAQQVFAELGFPDREAVAWMQIGEIYEEYYGDYEQALSRYSEAEKLIQPIDDKEVLPSIYRAISSAYRKLKRWDMAKQYGQKALQEAQEMNQFAELYILHQHLSTICEHLGELPEALQHHKRYAALREEVLGTEKQKAIAEMQAKFDVESAEREKEIFRLRNVELVTAMEEISRLNRTLAELNEEKNKLLRLVEGGLKTPLLGMRIAPE